jgi:AAA15 family ATPase/GTPase
MLESTTLRNYGPLSSIDWSNLGPINLIIGENGSGKTFLLKALYTAVKTLESYKRGDDKRPVAEILHEKLYWTFQVDRLGDVVKKRADGALFFTVKIGGRCFKYEFEKDAKQIISLKNTVDPRQDNSIFLPAKEVLSLQNVILKSRERDQEFGFDDTYLDLARALRPATKGRNYEVFSNSRGRLKDILGGRVEYEESSGRWFFKKGNTRFSIGTVAEGVKKIGILDALLGNRYITPNSIIFIDEPESALHPVAILQLLDIVADLAENGIQFFLASHSYFVVKKLFLIAQQRKDVSVPVLSFNSREWEQSNLKDGMPSNSIIDASIRLYREEVEVTL